MTAFARRRRASGCPARAIPSFFRGRVPGDPFQNHDCCNHELEKGGDQTKVNLSVARTFVDGMCVHMPSTFF